MVFWAVVAGALIGLCSNLGMSGLILGGFVGALMGTWLQNLLRAELNRTIELRTNGWPNGQSPAGAAPAVQTYSAPVAPDPAPQMPAEQAPPPEFTAPAAAPVFVAAPAPLPTPEIMAQAWPDAAPAQRRAAMPAEAADQATSSAGGSGGGGDDSYRDWLDDGPFDRARDWLMGGNMIVRAGLVVLFIGLVFLARLVVQAGLFPIEARLATIAAAGAALLAVGFAKRITRPDFGLQMQGAGVAVLYLTVFAGARIYEVIPPGAAFGFMIVFAALGAALAVMQNSLTLAMASFLGGYAVPVLLGGHAETPTGLFTYMTVLNAGVMGIAWRKSWRPLNLLGFAATFLLASLWGFTSYTDRNFLICELFLGLSVAIYLATAMLYAHNTRGKLGNLPIRPCCSAPRLPGSGCRRGWSTTSPTPRRGRRWRSARFTSRWQPGRCGGGAKGWA